MHLSAENASSLLAAAPAHGPRLVCVVAKQQQARGVRPRSNPGPAVLQQPRGAGNPLRQDPDSVSEGERGDPSASCEEEPSAGCAFVCAASGETHRGVDGSSQAGCVPLVRLLFGLRPRPGRPACGVRTSLGGG